VPTFKLTRGTRDRVSADRAGVPSARRYEDRVKLGPDGETVPRTCTFNLDYRREIICGQPVWEGSACLNHYIRRGLFNAGILRSQKKGTWQAKREIQTYVKERDAIVAFFSQRLRAVRDELVQPVGTFSEAYAVLDELWNFAGLNRRQPANERIAAFVSFISRQDYIAKHGWYNRDWVGDPANRRRKEARNDQGTVGSDPELHLEGIRRPDEAGLGRGDEVGDRVEASDDPLDSWDAPGDPERVPDGGA